MSVEAVSLAGDVLLANSQRAAGQVTAAASSRIGVGNAGSPITASRVAVEGNSAASEATANRTFNSLTAALASASTGRTAIDNRQRNDADVQATTKVAFAAAGSGASGAAIGIEANSASSLARGNVAENRMSASGGVGNPGGGDAVQPPMALLSNRQVNSGAVAAKTIVGAGVALNCGCTSNSRIGVADNASSASAYGNTALNSMALNGNGRPTPLVSNGQTNSGPVSATVGGRLNAASTGGLNASMVTIGSNSLTATAVGNHTTNTLTATVLANPSSMAW